MANSRSAALRLVPLLVLLPACMSGKGGPQRTVEVSEGGPVMNELDSGMVLKRDLEIRNPISNQTSKSPDEFLRCQFELHNKRSTAMKLEWKVDWFDGSGFRVETNEPWRPLTIGGYGYEIIQIVAPSLEAEVWRLRVQ